MRPIDFEASLVGSLWCESAECYLMEIASERLDVFVKIRFKSTVARALRSAAASEAEDGRAGGQAELVRVFVIEGLRARGLLPNKKRR